MHGPDGSLSYGWIINPDPDVSDSSFLSKLICEAENQRANGAAVRSHKAEQEPAAERRPVHPPQPRGPAEDVLHTLTS